jgi:L-ascorbate metabolism protein UlaG (beta-lactamase superfamily)
MVRVRWCGHSYFIIEHSKGSIAIDPHDGGSIGVSTCRYQADLVLVTHNHFDHNAVEVASGPSTKVVKWRAGEVLDAPLIRGFKFYHDKASGRLRGTVVAYLIEVDGVRILHLSDIGHIPPKEAVESIGRVDVLLVPAGGVYTIDALEAWEVIQLMKPKIAVPMHYWVEGVILPLDPLERFLNIIKVPRERLESNEFEVHIHGLPEKTHVFVPRPPKTLWSEEAATEY